MKNTLTNFFLFLFVFLSSGNFSWAQFDGNDETPVAVLGVIQTNNGSGGGEKYKVNKDCEFQPSLVTALANIDEYSTANENGEYAFPEDHSPMYLAYSINGGLVQRIQLTSFKYYGQNNGVSIFYNVTSPLINMDEECSASEELTVHINTYLVTPVNGNPSEGFEQYPACNHTDKFDIFSCHAITYCDVDGEVEQECNQDLLTSGTDLFKVSCGKECKTDSNDHFGQLEVGPKNNTEKKDSQIKVSPNPFSNEIIVSLPSNETTSQISLIDSKGKVIQVINKNQINDSIKITMATNQLLTGIYFIKVTNQNSSKVLKLIKQ